jgi:hypothetical protein
MSNVAEVIGYAISILETFGLMPIVTGLFVIVVTAIGGAALVRALRE